MAVVTGLAESFSPSSVEFQRVSFDVPDKEYYNPNRTQVILLSSMGAVPGQTATADQREKGKVSLVSKVVDQVQFEIMTHNPSLTLTTTAVTGALTTGVRGTVNVMTVSDASIFRPFDVVVNMTTNEQMLVTAIDTGASPNEISYYPAFSQTGFSGLTAFPWTLSNAAAAAKTNGDVLRIVGTAFAEGSVASSIYDSRPTTAVNYVQIFREDYGATFEEESVKKNGKMSLKDKEARAMGDLLVKMERAVIESNINSQSSTVNSVAGTTRSMQGIIGTVSTYNQAASALVGGGNDITTAKLDQIIDQLMPANQAGYILCLCTGTFIRKINSLMRNDTRTDVVPGAEAWGLKAIKYDGQIPVYFVNHDVFSGGRTTAALFIDPTHYKLTNLRGGELGKVSGKKGLPGLGLATNSTMSLQDAWYGAYSLEYRFEAGSSYVTGLSHSIS